MKYLTIDGELSGSGIRNSNEGGYISPEELNLTSQTVERLKSWLLKYENEHYNGYVNSSLIDELDDEGKKIAITIRQELPEVKVEYFSSARMRKEMI